MSGRAHEALAISRRDIVDELDIEALGQPLRSSVNPPGSLSIVLVPFPFYVVLVYDVDHTTSQSVLNTHVFKDGGGREGSESRRRANCFSFVSHSGAPIRKPRVLCSRMLEKSSVQPWKATETEVTMDRVRYLLAPSR